MCASSSGVGSDEEAVGVVAFVDEVQIHVDRQRLIVLANELAIKGRIAHTR